MARSCTPRTSTSPRRGRPWPAHGIAGTPNAELHPALRAVLADRPDATLRKGQHAAAYSGFAGIDEHGRTLSRVLADAGITAVDVVGIAESHCVKATALDAAALGLQTTVLTDLTVPVTEELGVAARGQMCAAGVRALSREQAAARYGSESK